MQERIREASESDAGSFSRKENARDCYSPGEERGRKKERETDILGRLMLERAR